MRLYNRVISQVLFVMLGLSSCVTEKFDDINALEQHTRSGYVYFRIETTDRLTRASSDDLEPDGNDNHSSGDLVNGQELEHKIGAAGNFCLFFSDKGGFVNAFPLELAKIDPVPDKPVGGDQHVREAVYGVKITVDEDEVFPKQFLVVLNGQPVYQKLSALTPGMTVDKVLEQIWVDENPLKIGKNDDGLFTMTSSIYMDGSEKKSTVSITKDNIQQEGSFDPDKVVIAHVERIVSKYSLVLENDEDGIFTPAVTDNVAQNHQVVLCTGWTNKYQENVQSDPITTDDWEPIYELRNWQAKFLGWGMNALEKESHIFKNIQNKNYFAGWNDVANFRSYWSEDPHYQGDYPWQNRRAVDNNLYWYSNPSNAWTNLLLNYSWENEALNYQPGNGVIYTPENTYSADDLRDKLDGRMELLAGTHLIARTELQVQNAINSEDYFVPDYLYRDRAGVCYTTAQDCLWGLVRAFNYALSSQTVLKYRNYDWNPDRSSNTTEILFAVPTITYDDNSMLDNGHFKLYYRGEEMTYEYIRGMSEKQCRELLIAANVKDGDGKRLLDTSEFSVKKIDPNDQSKITELPIYSEYNIGVDPKTKKEYDNSKYLLSRNETQKKNDIQSLFFEWAGPVDLYLNGMMYYAYPACVIENEVYGAVRNAWYQFKVTGINNIGIPVHDVKMEIVPNWDNPFNQINVKVNILDWHDFTFNLGDATFNGNTDT